MTHILAYIFGWLAWLSTWCQTRGVATLDVLLCAFPLVLILGFVWTHILNPYKRGWKHGGITYHDFWSDE